MKLESFAAQNGLDAHSVADCVRRGIGGLPITVEDVREWEGSFQLGSERWYTEARKRGVRLPGSI